MSKWLKFFIIKYTIFKEIFPKMGMFVHRVSEGNINLEEKHLVRV